MKLCMFSPRGQELERGWPGRVDGDVIVQLAAQTLQAFFTGGGGAREHATYAVADCVLRPPVLYPPAVRVFSPFDRAETPFFSFRSPHPVLGPDETLRYPPGTEELDYGLGIAVVIGLDGAIGGFTLANDWTARDLSSAERAAGFGPSKSSDFGLSLGPVVVTPDEEIGPALVAHAARGTELRPGDILIARDPGRAAGPPLRRGDVVELECDGIGVLGTRVA